MKDACGDRLFLPPVTFGLASATGQLNALRMNKPDQLRELFRMQQMLNERIGVKTDGMSDEKITTSRHSQERKDR
jgi:hypothetical protein